jgi:orotidine 5'-phosphate decarboxylase subfamily 2
MAPATAPTTLTTDMDRGSAPMQGSRTSAFSDPALPASFNARLDQAIEATGSLLCVGLDPLPERIDEPVADFCRRMIDATAAAAVAFKPNIAFFEVLGPAGLADLITVLRHLPEDRLMILDAKRGDIGSTAQAYARAAFHTFGADAVTVNPYLGGDAVAPFLADPAKGAFVLCHTSNPGAADFQTLDVGGRPLYLEVARQAAGWNTRGNVGLVVGATYPEALAAVRAQAPDLPFLVPGIGAQGGALEDAVKAGRDAQERGLVVNSSRDIIFAGDPALAALRLRDAINAARVRR